jgi:hypothetical protein
MITPLGSRLGLLILVTPHMAANNSICSTLFGLLHSVHRWPRVSVSFDPQVHPQRCRSLRSFLAIPLWGPISSTLRQNFPASPNITIMAYLEDGDDLVRLDLRSPNACAIANQGNAKRSHR